MLSRVISYRIEVFSDGSGGKTSIIHADRTDIRINPFFNSHRVDAQSVDECAQKRNRTFTYSIFHEARHTYQNFLSNGDFGAPDDDGLLGDPDNDDDQDFLVDQVPVSPKNILIDSNVSRLVCSPPNGIFSQPYKGEATLDTLRDPDNVIFALENDASTYGAIHQ